MTESGLDKEYKVGAMIRHLSGDISTAFEKKLKDMYTNGDGELDEIGECCAKWHWTVVKYASNPSAMRDFIAIIQYAFEYKFSLDKSSSWKTLMRTVLPEEFLRKMSGFTQVPQLAVMDETKLVETEEKEWDEVNW